MNGRLAKAIRRAAGFHPAADRGYRLEKVTNRVGIHSTFKTPFRYQTGTFVAEGKRAHYQSAKKLGIRQVTV